MVTIKSNQAVYGGGLYILNNSHVIFVGDSLITNRDRKGTEYGGGLA